MKKILLIEDRATRQEFFLEGAGIDFKNYAGILDNFINDDYEELKEQILRDSFNFTKYDIIISHKSAYENDNSLIINKLKNYAKTTKKILIFFSGGISVNYYDNSEFKFLELNSKTFYSQNLKLFLETVRTGDENILMLCYGENWKFNVVSNVLEKTNLFLDHLGDKNSVLNKFVLYTDLNKLSQIDYKFYDIITENGWISSDEIQKFKDSIIKYFQDCNTYTTTKADNISLLIHNDNVVETPFLYDIVFNNEDDIDTYISTKIISDLSSKEFNKIFIKDSLSSNYLDLLGLRVAYHIRLSEKLKAKRFLPIVIISEFDSATLMRFSNEAEILFTDGTYLCNNAKEDIVKLQSLELKGLSQENYIYFLNQIRVSPPKDTSGSHDIANKWSIYRWSLFLKVESETVKKNKEEIENQLYFKYLKALNQSQTSKTTSIIKPSKKGKVLLIDDEWDKGWGDVLKKALSIDDLEFNVFEYDFKDKTNFNLIIQLKYKNLKDQIAEADVVILDLRLIETDHENDDLENYTGIQILEKIHEINAGIQVIMLTATSKSSILEKLYEKKILGYIKKEHPDDINIDTAENINKLVKMVDKGLERKFLKKVFLTQNKLLQLSLFQVKFSFDMPESDKKLLELKNTISMIFETLDSNIPKPFIYGMFTLYKCIEIICDYFIYEQYDVVSKKQRAYWRENSRAIENDGNASINNKIKNIIAVLQINENNNTRLIDELSCSRNYEIHPGEIKPACKGRVIQNPNETHLVPWLELIETILIKLDNII